MNNSNTGACTLACQLPACGDQFVQPSNMEECDDGNLANTDGCLATCKTAKCGDTFVQMGVEQCDDGNMVNTDTCTATCKSAACGDTFVQMSNMEMCDDGNVINTDTCTAMCKNAACGDGIVQMGVDQCDDGNMINTDACVAGCKAAVCGDGFVRAGVEQCDDGNMNANDGCNNMCGCVDVQVTVNISFAQAIGWNVGGCCGQANYRVGNGMGGSISGTFMDPVPPGKVVKSVLVKAGVEHACNAGQSMLFRYENTQIGTWGAGNGPDCQCGNPAVGNASFNAPINLYKVGQNNSVSIFHNAGGSCHEAITNVPGAPVGTAFQVVITYSGC
jgi:cysteine-rich repeat protein